MTGTERPARAHPVERLGPRLRASRLERRLTLEQVADAVHVTKGFLSRLERGDTSVSIAVLARICDVLGIRLGDLFEYAPSSLVRADDAPKVDVGGAGMAHTLLSPSHVPQLRVIRVEIDPGAGAGTESYRWDAQIEFAHVVSGEIEIELEGVPHVLGAGDSLTFEGSMPHTYRNPSTRRRAVVLWTLVPKS